MTTESDTGALSATPSYGYDKTGRLSTTGTHSVAYTTLTNPTTLPTGASATYDTTGELTSATKATATTSYTYDSIGARTKVAPSTGQTLTYGYDALGELTSAKSTAATGPLSGTGVAFTYGATGIPVSKTTNAGATTTLVWGTGGANPELLAAGATYLIRGPTGRVVEQVNTTSTTPTYLVGDQLGSTRLLTDQAGTVVATYTYGPYGAVTGHTGTATSPVGYARGLATATTGLVNFEHRWLTTGTGSWLTLDPLVATTTQPYQYATEDPVNSRDPNGQFGIPVVGWCIGNCTPQGTGFTQFPLVAYGHNQCSGGFACGYVWNPVVRYYNSLTSSARVTSKTAGHLVTMLTGLYSRSTNRTWASACRAGPHSCLNNVLIPGLGTAANPGAFFQLAQDNSLVWWAQELGPTKLGEFADAIDLFDNLGAPFVEYFLGSTVSTSSSTSSIPCQIV